MAVKTAMLITVGTSLIENLRKERIKECGSFTDPSNDSPLLGAKSEQIIAVLYDRFSGNLQDQLHKNLSGVSFLSAEVQSFCFWLSQQPPGSVALSHIILMPTKTADKKAETCAEKVKKIFQNQVFNSEFAKPYLPDEGVKISIKPFRLRLENEHALDEDIAGFLRKLDEDISTLGEKGIRRIVLNITGGYKGLTPFFSLVGFLQENVEVIYQHEEANLVLRVPPLPLAWDYKLFDEYRSLIRAKDEVTITALPEKFRLLFEEKGERWVENPFGKLLENIYIQDRLKRFGYGVRLIRRLPSELQEELEGRIPRWEHIWIGDQIPETVEHSKGHSGRVMEYAASLLEPLFARYPKFLNGEELYCLICCLWLHDIGHTALTYRLPDDKVIPIALFPTLVRMFHNFLSEQRILDYDYLPKKDREIVALISKYDRAAMPLRKDDESWKKGKAFGVTADPLEEELAKEGIAFRGQQIGKDRILLLCSLLQIIDALDVQSDRVVDDYYWAERKQRTREEVDYYRSLLGERLPSLDVCSGKPDELANRARDLACRVDTAYNEWVESLEVSEEFEDTFKKELVQLVHDVLYLDDKETLDRELLTEVLSLLDRIGFKMLQEAHFRKHSRVKLVYLTYRDGPSNFPVYHIQMIFDMENSITLRDKQKIAGEIWKEVKKVNNILSDNDLYFEGVFEGDTRLQPAEGETG